LHGQQKSVGDFLGDSLPLVIAAGRAHPVGAQGLTTIGAFSYHRHRKGIMGTTLVAPSFAGSSLRNSHVNLLKFYTFLYFEWFFGATPVLVQSSDLVERCN
jgi:hypothetical protein